MIVVSALIPLALLLVVVYFCARALWRATTIPSELLHGERCGKCSYDLGGAGATHCPECGADLYDAGLLTPVMQLDRRPGGCAASLAWTVLVFILALVSIVGVGVFSDSFMSESDTNRVQTSTTFTPKQGWNLATRQREGNEYSIDLTTDVIVMKDKFKRGTIYIRLTAPGGMPASTQMDADTLRSTDRESERFDQAAAISLMKTAGLNTSLDSIREEAVHLVGIVVAARHGGSDFPWWGPNPRASSCLISDGSSVVSTNLGPPKGLVAAVATIALWAFAWLAGLTLISRRRASLYTRAAAAEPG